MASVSAIVAISSATRTVYDRVCVSCGLELSATSTSNVSVVALASTVPVSAPAALIATPSGSDPLETANVYGAVPPVAATFML